MDGLELREIGEDNTLLLVDDDEPFVKRLARAMEKRGFEPLIAQSVAQGRAIVATKTPAYAVVDLRLEDGNGLDIVEALREKRPEARIIVLTGYGAIATAVAAVKIGRWEHIQRVFELCDRNVSETARRLNMHRRTLQRILAKRSPK